MKIYMWILVLIFSMSLSSFLGYKYGSKAEKITQTEMNKIDNEKNYQILPKNADLTEALAGGHYSHCVVYPGVGLFFSHKDNDGNLIVEQSPLTYPARTALIMPGYKIITPLDVIMGDLNSPVKIEYKPFVKDQGNMLKQFMSGFKTESTILNRVMIKKCYRKMDLSDKKADGSRNMMNQ